MITTFGKWRVGALLAALSLIGMGGTAFAQTGGTVAPPRMNNNALQMQIERNQIQTQTYRLQQKIYREQDRQNSMQRPQQQNVPVYHSTCTPTNGVPCN
ncbi:MAG: hypothetical protein ACTHJV_14220 [Rhizobiaceae bacterium]